MRDKFKFPVENKQNSKKSESNTGARPESDSEALSQANTLTKSDHFDGEKFFNRTGNFSTGFFKFLKFAFGGPSEDWPELSDESAKESAEKNSKLYVAKERNALDVVDLKLSQRLAKGEVSVTFINHATVLIQADGLNLITDPIFSMRASPFSWMGPKRSRLPGIALDELPPIDVVLVSHNHYDHMDEESLKWFAQKNPKTLFLVPLGDGHWLKKWKISNFKELDWAQQVSVGDGSEVQITFEEAQHWSGRWLNDRRTSLWGSFIIKTSQGLIYFGGDTGYGPHFSRIQKQYGDFTVSLLPIGAYEPRDFMKYQHMNPEEAVQAHLDLHSKQSIGIHYGTFKLTYEGINDPVEHLAKAKEKLKIGSNDFITLERGESTKVKKISP